MLKLVRPPAGEHCLWCEEVFEPADSAVPTPLTSLEGVRLAYYHRPCFMRSIVGSVAHQEGRCSCFGGVEPEIEPGLTKRQEALKAWLLWLARNPPESDPRLN